MTTKSDRERAEECLSENLGEWEIAIFNRPITGEEFLTLEKMATFFFLAGLAAARPRWVPVSERPPSENDAYVVLFRDGDYLVRDVCVFHNGEWDLNTCYGNSISYWLEGLPEDPAPETEGE